MEAEAIVLFIGTVAGIIIFSVALGFWTAQLGYRSKELRERLSIFDARYRTVPGRRARIPRLVTNARNPFQRFGRILLPIGVNGLILTLLFVSGTYPLILTPLVFIAGALEWWLIWQVQKRRRAGYEAEFREFLRLTAPGNRVDDFWLFEGDGSLSMSDTAALRIVRSGRILSASLSHPSWAPAAMFRLFCPKDIDLPPETVLVSPTLLRQLSGPHRVFYRETEAVDGVPVDGILVGVELSPAPLRAITSYDYEQHLARKPV